MLRTTMYSEMECAHTKIDTREQKVTRFQQMRWGWKSCKTAAFRQVHYKKILGSHSAHASTSVAGPVSQARIKGVFSLQPRING